MFCGGVREADPILPMFPIKMFLFVEKLSITRTHIHALLNY